MNVVQHGHLSEFVAATLAAHASHLAQHWIERALAATPRSSAVPGTAPGGAPGAPSDAEADVERAVQVVRALAASVLSSTAASLVMAGEHAEARRVLAGGNVAGRPHGESDLPAADMRPAGEMMRLGWSAGAAAFATGQSVHHVVRDADLLLAVVLADVERAVADLPPGPGVTAADAMAVARRLHRATGRYGQAAVSGFVHALLRGLRERYRVLRHDLRNPLGTIRSALSLMEDETVPVETRHGPNIRAMVARNAGSLDRLISRRLDDAAATALLAPPHQVRLRDVVQAARREVREAARLAGVEVVVDVHGDAPSHVDGAALELTLTTVLLAAIARAAPGAAVRVSCADRAPHSDQTPGALPGSPCGATDENCVCVVMRVDVEPAEVAAHHEAGGGADAPALTVPRWDEHGLDLAVALAGDHGGRLGVEADVPAVRDAAALVAALSRAPSIFLRLPLIEPSIPSAERPAPSGRAVDAELNSSARGTPSPSSRG